MKRRDFIRTGAGYLAAFAGASSFLQACHTEEDMIGESNWIIETSFDRPLSFPSVTNGSASFNAQFSTTSILKDKVTQTLAYGNGVLGPTIRANTGDTISVALRNDLTEETNIHWHGLILPEDMDGHPTDVAASGETLNYLLPINQRAGTYWYHPHAHGTTAKQVFMGLAGMFIVNDDEEASLNLPSGEFELPLIIQDKHFSGVSLDYSPTSEEIMKGYLGEQIIVNGVHAPYLGVATRWYRFRILNGSTARVYNLALSNGQDFYLIGNDGGLLETTQQLKTFLLGPGERADVLVNFGGLSVGKEIFLQSNSFSKYDEQGRQGFKIMKFVVERNDNSLFVVPTILSSIQKLSTALSVKTRTFDISGGGQGHGGSAQHAINGKPFEMERIDETVEAGTTEIWEFDNLAGDEIHPMHIHGVQFQILQRVGGRNQLIATEQGWKDSVLVMAGEKVSVIMTFPEYKGRFVFHCHNLEHEDDGMMMNYEIV
jgi:blue copper oxidase